MSDRTMEFAQRQGVLHERIAAQRRALATHAAPLESALAGVDKALAGVDWLKKHPEVVGFTVAVGVVVSPKRAWRWTRRAFIVWRGWRSVRNLLVTAR
jgi:hypothetical protein